MTYSREELINALQREYEYLTHDDFNPFEDMTAEQHLEWLQKLSWRDLVEETSTGEGYTLDEWMENWG